MRSCCIARPRTGKGSTVRYHSRPSALLAILKMKTSNRKLLKMAAPLIVVALGYFGVNLDKYGIDLNSLLGGNGGSQSSSTNSGSGHAGADYAQWSSTTPEINLWHVFEGEINRSGKPVGYHSRPGGRDAANARVTNVRDQPNGLGVYTANIEIRDGNSWKGKFSSFFPDSLSRDEVVAAVLHAYNNSSNPQAQPFEGPSGLGFVIQGYTSNRGGINTAFPIYVRGQ